MSLTLSLILSLIDISGKAVSPQTEIVQQAEASLSTIETRTLVEAFAESLEMNFVFPETGIRYATMLRANATSGLYDKFTNRRALTKALTEDVQRVARDAHLEVFPYRPDLSGSAKKQRGPSAPRPPEVEGARWIVPNVAFIRFNSFLGTKDSIAATEAFVRDYADAQTVIIDIRTHRGGGMDEMDILFPALFEQPTKLVVMETRAAVIARDGDPLADRPTIKTVESSSKVVRQEHWALPPPKKSNLAKAKVYVLTSGAAASAAEHFALAMKRTGRAKLIGETTAGAGHFGELMPLPHEFAALVPVGRTYDPDTGKGWETVGVEPDIEVPAERALTEVLERLGFSTVDAQRISTDLAPQSSMHRRVRSGAQ